MSPALKRATLMLLFFMPGLVSGAGAATSTNPIRKIDVQQMDRVMASADFSALVVVMASWCPPCREELPALTRLYNRYRKKGRLIIGLSIDQDISAMQQLVDDRKIPFPVYWVGRKGLSHYRLVGVPVLWVVKNGHIIDKLPGRQSEKSFRRQIKRLLAP